MPMIRVRVAAIFVNLCLGAVGAALSGLASTVPAAERAVVLEIDGAIGPPVADYIARELGSARAADARLIILRMNTPGGLDTSMRRIISAILASPVPVA